MIIQIVLAIIIANQVDCLINCAGVKCVPDWTTGDGHEYHIGVNYLVINIVTINIVTIIIITNIIIIIIII